MSRRWVGVLLLMFAMQVQGGELLPFMPSASEMALLPEYCKVRFTDQHSPQYQAWMQRVGPKFLDMHHYCAGLNYINRYQRLANDEKRDYYLSRAVPEIDYVANNMPADFVLAGEIYLNRGIAYRLMRNDAAAAGDFMRAIERDPRQVRAYLYLSDIQMKSGDKAQALALVSRGLEHVPAAKALQRKYLELGGKEPFPKAETPPVPEAVAPVKGDGGGELAVTPNPGTSPMESMPALEQGTGHTPERVENGAAGGESKQRPIGSPTNPYCRFCPD